MPRFRGHKGFDDVSAGNLSPEQRIVHAAYRTSCLSSVKTVETLKSKGCLYKGENAQMYEDQSIHESCKKKDVES